MGNSKVYLDFETFNIQPYCLAPPPVVMVLAIDSEKPDLIHVRDSAFRRTLRDLWENPKVDLVAQGAYFETCVTLAYEPEWTPIVFSRLRANGVYCTIIRQKLGYIGEGVMMDGKEFNLAALCDWWKLGIHLDKQDYWRTRFGTLINTPVSLFPDEARAYVMGDVAVRDVFEAQEEGFEARFLVNQFHRVRYDVSLYLTSCNGFPTDPELGRILYNETFEKLDEYRDTLLENGLLREETKKGETVYVKNQEVARGRIVAAYSAQGRDPPRGAVTASQLQKAYIAAGVGHKAPKWTPEQKKRVKVDKNMIEKAVNHGVPREVLVGNISVDEESCENSGDPLMLAYTRNAQAGTLLGKVKRLQFPLIQTSYDVLKSTGRTSSRQGEDPEPGEPWKAWGMQVQNLPRVGDEIEEDTK